MFRLSYEYLPILCDVFFTKELSCPAKEAVNAGRQATFITVALPLTNPTPIFATLIKHTLMGTKYVVF